MQIQDEKLLDIPGAIWKQKKLISLATLVGSVIGLLITAYNPIHYEVIAKIVQLPLSNPHRILSTKRTEPLERNTPPTWEDIEGQTHKTILLNNYLEMVTSSDMLNFVIKKLALNEEGTGNFKTASELKSMIKQRVRLEQGETVMLITVKGENPELITQIANVIIDRIIETSKLEEDKVVKDIEKRLKNSTDYLKSQSDLTPFDPESDFQFLKAYKDSKVALITSLNDQISKYQSQWESVISRLESFNKAPDQHLLAEQIAATKKELHALSVEIHNLIAAVIENSSELGNWQKRFTPEYYTKENLSIFKMASYEGKMKELEKIVLSIPLKLKIKYRAEAPANATPSPMLVNFCFAALFSFELAIFMAILLEFWKRKSQTREHSSNQ